MKKWSIPLKNMYELEALSRLLTADKDVNSLSVDTLSYIGDAVYELFFRLKTLSEAKRRTGYQHELLVKLVNASGQSQALVEIEELLTEEDKKVVNRGFNSRGAKRRGNDIEYRRATALETLVGYLYIKGDFVHLEEILSKVVADVLAR
ncbi:ribonuclease III domain-containing protein [Kosmotoga sp.]|uniref:Mini-ribonuclease 3 n=1 Tax=Kosmotoga sp. TaxID=1955248 RepID=UPI0025C3E65E|nr:ribonuclease III domain-containing protein [Kosmotoga sp.]